MRVFQISAVALVLAGLSVLVAVAMARTDGMLVYTLDDPYIHLAVASSILEGGYGVNPGEFAAPSSSILYPLLLAGTLLAGLGTWGPLVLAGAGAAATAWLLAGTLWAQGVDSASLRSRAFAVLTLPVMLLAVNAVALPLTGMEHTLHMAASVAVVAGLFDLRRDAPVPGLLIAGAILAPLLRFEGLALALAAIAALLIRRKFGAALLVAAILGAVYAAFGALLLRHGVPLLPSSVMVKSEAMATAAEARYLDLLIELGETALDSFNNRYGTLFGVGIALMTLALSWRGGAFGARLSVALAVALALLGHVFIGHFNWFSRYEIYGMAILIAALILLYSDMLRDVTHRYFFKTTGVILFLTLLAADYTLTVFKSPAASQNIYSQQYQMHRFATEFLPVPVAVNDLGYVAYDNDTYVLDLWGLGSETARRAAGGGRSQDTLRALVRDAGARYAMIYDGWFGRAIPDEWCRIATLKTFRVSTGRADVAFYLIDPEMRAAMDAALDAFAPTLPERASLARAACPDNRG